MNSKLVWVAIVLLLVYAGYLMTTKTATPVVETTVTENVVATTTEETMETNATGTPAVETTTEAPVQQ